MYVAADRPTRAGGGGFGDVDQPLLTYYDDATGERTALTADQLGRWAARCAGLLRHGWNVGPGSRAAVLLPPHWRTAVVLLGAWSAGVAVSFRPKATAGLPVLEPGADQPYDALFVTPARLDDWLEDVPKAWHRFVVGTGPGPLVEVPDGYHDWFTEVTRYPDDLPVAATIRPTDPASPDGTTYGEWGGVAVGLARQLDLRVGDRLLVDAAEHEQPLKWLLAPLAAGASVVICANLDRTKLNARIAAEQVTRFL